MSNQFSEAVVRNALETMSPDDPRRPQVEAILADMMAKEAPNPPGAPPRDPAQVVGQVEAQRNEASSEAVESSAFVQNMRTARDAAVAQGADQATIDRMNRDVARAEAGVRELEKGFRMSTMDETLDWAGSVGKTGWTLATGILGYLTGMGKSIPVAYQEGSEEAYKTLQQTMKDMTYVSSDPKDYQMLLNLGDALSSTIGEIEKQGGKAMDFLGVTDPYTREWIAAGFGAISPSQLARLGSKSAKSARAALQVLDAQSKGYRLVPSDLSSNANAIRRMGESVGGANAVKQRVAQFNQARANFDVADQLGFSGDNPLTRPNLARSIAERDAAQTAYQASLRPAGKVDLAMPKTMTDLLRINGSPTPNPAIAMPGPFKREFNRITQLGPITTDQLLGLAETWRGYATDAFKSMSETATQNGRAWAQGADYLESIVRAKSWSLHGSMKPWDEFTQNRQWLAQARLVEKHLDEAGNVRAPSLAKNYEALRNAHEGAVGWDGGKIETLARLAKQHSTSFANPDKMKGYSNLQMSIFDLMLGGPVAAAIGYTGFAAPAVGLAALMGTRTLARRLAQGDKVGGAALRTAMKTPVGVGMFSLGLSEQSNILPNAKADRQLEESVQAQRGQQSFQVEPPGGR